MLWSLRCDEGRSDGPEAARLTDPTRPGPEGRASKLPSPGCALSGAGSTFHLHAIPSEGTLLAIWENLPNSIPQSVAPTSSTVDGSGIANSPLLPTYNPREPHINCLNASGGAALHRP